MMLAIMIHLASLAAKTSKCGRKSDMLEECLRNQVNSSQKRTDVFEDSVELKADTEAKFEAVGKRKLV